MSAELWIDTSKYQGIPDYARVKAAGVVGDIHNVDDPGFMDRVAGALGAGLRTAAYKFFAPGVGRPDVAGASFVNQVKPVRGHLDFLAGDYETGVGDLTLWCLGCQQGITVADNGIKPWFYSGAWWVNQHIKPNAYALTAYPLWAAGPYGGQHPAIPPPWTGAAAFQFTSTGHIPGISGSVDEDWLYATFGGFHVVLNKPVVAGRLTPSGKGYAMVTADGGYFPFGDAPQGLGSEGNVKLAAPIVAFDFTPTGRGYAMFAADGGVFPFGDAPQGLGSLAG